MLTCFLFISDFYLYRKISLKQRFLKGWMVKLKVNKIFARVKQYEGWTKKMKTGKLIWVTVVTRFLLKDNVPKQHIVQK